MNLYQPKFPETPWLQKDPSLTGTSRRVFSSEDPVMITNGAFAEGDAFAPQYPHSLPLFAFSKNKQTNKKQKNKTKQDQFSAQPEPGSKNSPPERNGSKTKINEGKWGNIWESVKWCCSRQKMKKT